VLTGRKRNLALDPENVYRIDMREKTVTVAQKDKNPAAVELGRLGGQVRVPKGFAVLTKEQRKEAARIGATARWEKRKKKQMKGPA
jgi:hypothetical protein